MIYCRLIFYSFLLFVSWLVGVFSPFLLQGTHHIASSSKAGRITDTCMGLFANNLTVMIKNITSFFFLGLPSLFNLYVNGFVFGSVLQGSIASGMISRQKMALLIFPHAIFEFLAQILSATISMEIGFQIVHTMLLSDRVSFPILEIKILLRLILITFILTLLAACIETQLTFRQL